MLALPAQATELYAGISAHGVNLGLVRGTYEHGADLVGGIRSAPIARFSRTEVRVHAFGSVNLNGGVDYIATGADLRIPLIRGVYVQPGLGAAVHDGPGDRYQRTPDRLYLGSRVLFEPELTLGVHATRSWSAELAYVHLSHAQLAGPQNPGLDTIGLRLAYRFGR